MPSSSGIYELFDLVHCYGSRTVLSLNHLRIERGAITALSGPNGSGKSTLLRILAFLEKPTSGMIHFNDHPCSTACNDLRGQVTLLLQEPYLLKQNVLKNVTYGLNIKGSAQATTKAHKALERVGLDPQVFSSRAWYELSGGEKQRVSLAARLALEPKVLLLDEPTSSVDELSATRIEEATLWAKKELGTTIVVVSHDRTWLNRICDTKIRLVRGEVAPPVHDQRIKN